MIENCRNNLIEIRSVINGLTHDQFAQSLEVLSHSSVGQHVRHVLEFYLCLLNGLEEGCVNYDARERNLEIESDRDCAIDVIDSVSERLLKIGSNKSLVLEGDAGVETSSPYSISTNIERELAYNLEHTIHHQALIKIGLRSLSIESIELDCFGVAPSTLRATS